MQMLKKLFSSENKYYLELQEEVKDSEVVQAAVNTASKTAEVLKEKVTEVANSQPVQEAVQKATEAGTAAQEKLASVVTEENPAEAKSAKTKVKSEPESKTDVKHKGKVAESDKQVAESDKQEQAKPNLENSGASSFDPPFWVAAMYNNSNNTANSNGKAVEETFAPDNLMPTITKYRRRPGGSLDKFKDMAKKAKTPKA